jgi:NAD(P)-dependent dehydrogenase (short-subunit alcohol dehydrogenase family)
VNRTLSGHVAIVTGGSSGIGQAAALALAARGARVVVVGRTPAHVDATIARIDALPGFQPAHRIGLTLDVRREEDMAAMASRTLDSFGRIDILVASAGVSPGTAGGRMAGAAVAKLPPESWDDILDTNLRGMFLANRAVLPAMMRQREGEIVNVSSSLGTTPGWAYASAYCASKFAVVGMSEALAEEVRPFGIRVQVLLPDAVDTPMLRATHLGAFGALPPDRLGEFVVLLVMAKRDMVLSRPLIAPFRTASEPGRRTLVGV